eukprot:2611713-Prymnesium_polylepis.1
MLAVRLAAVDRAQPRARHEVTSAARLGRVHRDSRALRVGLQRDGEDVAQPFEVAAALLKRRHVARLRCKLAGPRDVLHHRVAQVEPPQAASDDGTGRRRRRKPDAGDAARFEAVHRLLLPAARRLHARHRCQGGAWIAELPSSR